VKEGVLLAVLGLLVEERTSRFLRVAGRIVELQGEFARLDDGQGMDGFLFHGFLVFDARRGVIAPFHHFLLR
jgi:hypothetical protein